MSLQKKFQDRIRRKEQEIEKMEADLAESRAYLQGLVDAQKLLPRDSDGEEAPTIRPGSLVGQTLALLQQAGCPLHVNAILDALGMPRERRNSIASQLAAYSRRGDTFERTAPNTYGLIEWREGGEASVGDRDEPPSGFGAVN